MQYEQRSSTKDHRLQRQEYDVIEIVLDDLNIELATPHWDMEQDLYAEIIEPSEKPRLKLLL